MANTFEELGEHKFELYLTQVPTYLEDDLRSKIAASNALSEELLSMDSWVEREFHYVVGILNIANTGDSEMENLLVDAEKLRDEFVELKKMNNDMAVKIDTFKDRLIYWGSIQQYRMESERKVKELEDKLKLLNN